jgi:hypothetical protein
MSTATAVPARPADTFRVSAGVPKVRKKKKTKKTSEANCRTENKNKRAAEKNKERRWWVVGIPYTIYPVMEHRTQQ